ncbi:phage tail protein [Clostridium sporogenes]|uniref:phage tail protein n=1 Tax=Clostridium sporogenes TaxID=1509 RepID=UPI002238D61B|nr:phage tail protein [Clostridium sporogenes]MCW6075460.1 phage tail protein [Clostridium sporogenes]
MSERFYTILTKLGKAKIANATALGTKVNLTKFQVGDGNGSYYNPTEDQTQLRNKVWESNISSIKIDENNPNWVVLETIIPGDVGGFMIREAAALDDEGNIISIGKYPETYKPVVGDGSTKDLYIRMILEVSNATSVTLKIDPSVILATKKDIEVITSNMSNLSKKVTKNTEDISEINEQLTNITEDAESLKDKVEGIEVPVTSVNKKTGDIILKAEDIKTNDEITLEDFKSASSKEINDIKKGIGTRNLIFNSNFKNGLSLWSSWNNTTINIDSNLNCIIKAVTSTSVGYGILTPTLSLVKDQKYTISFFASSYYNTSILNYIYIVSESTGTIKLDNVNNLGTLYSFCSITFTSEYSINDAKILIGSAKKGVTDEGFRLRNIKIEKGVIPTDWTPAPEEITNKLDTIQTGAEVNQNAISKININNQILNSTSKTDTIQLTLDNDIKTSISNKEIIIKKRNKLDDPLELFVNKTTGVDDNIETTPFKTIQAAIDYVKNYYAYLEKGVNIKITPGEYDNPFNINNFGVNYGVITLISTEAEQIPSGGNISDESHSVVVQQFECKNNATTIQFVGFTSRGYNPTSMKIDIAEGGSDYVKLLDLLSNDNLVFSKSVIYGSAGNLSPWKYYYGFRPYYTKILIRDSKLGQFASGTPGGNSAPIRIVDNSDVVLLNVKFEGNASFDIIAEESRVHLRNCSRTDGQQLKKNISKACLIAEA